MTGLARSNGAEPLGTPDAPELTAATLEALGTLLGADPQAIGRAIRARATQYPSVEEAVGDFLTSIAGVRSPATVKSYRSGLIKFSVWLEGVGLEPCEVTTVALPKDVLERYHRHLATTMGRERVASIHGYTAHARAFLKYLYGMGHGAPGISFEEVTLRLRALMGKQHYKAPRIDDDFGRIIEVADAISSPKFHEDRLALLRDRALLRVLLCTGARRAEVASLSRDDVKEGRADQALILGKGSKERVVFFDQPTMEVIQAYLSERDDLYRPLFRRHGRGCQGEPGRDGESWRLSPQSVWLVVKRYAALAGVRGTVHHFRHLKASTLLNNGAGLHHVQAILGHESPETTSRVYASFNTVKLREAFDRYS